jgi:hypothetical protein
MRWPRASAGRRSVASFCARPDALDRRLGSAGGTRRTDLPRAVSPGREMCASAERLDHSGKIRPLPTGVNDRGQECVGGRANAHLDPSLFGEIDG